MLCNECQVELVEDAGMTFCPSCDVQEYYFHIVTKYGPRECAERMDSDNAVVSGRNLLKT